jgi:light-regulated signal transduction histidine kinase (bacteriophytochrome)
MTLREIGETAIIYLTGAACEPSQMRSRGLNRGESDRPRRQIRYNFRRQSPHRNQRPPLDPTLSIQHYGAAIVIKEPELTIIQVSANTGPHFGYAPEELLDQPLALLLGETEVERLRDQSLSKDLDAGSHYLPAVRIGKGARLFELSLHRRQGVLILECEPMPDDANLRLDLTASLNSAIARMRRAGSVSEACQTTADEARRLTGFDRVMVYKFKEDGSGAVIAESLGGDFKSCLGLRYPASNITQQARAIYRSGRPLMKVDVNDQAVPLVPPVNPLTQSPLDLSYAVTRDLAPSYGAHLKKTGVTALMFITIAKNDRLWGLIMFYNHTGPKYASHDARMACELLAHCLSLQIAAEDEAENHEYMARIVRLNAELERSNNELDSFVCVASHDMKEPLRRMEALVNSMLNFSRVGRADLAMRVVDLDEVVSETLETIAPRLQESGAEIRRPRRLPIVRADRARVGEIFHNLIVNAIKNNDKPLKWVEIGWEEGQRDGGTERRRDREITESLRLSVPPSPPLSVSPPPPLPTPHSPVFYVRDNGIGIPELHYETIFGVFRRLHERDEFGGGVGAGLTIAKKIVERHNGRIWVESRVGEGTTVYFTLG